MIDQKFLGSVLAAEVSNGASEDIMKTLQRQRSDASSAPPALAENNNQLGSLSPPRTPFDAPDEDFRATQTYYKYYYSQRPLDHRLPPPLSAKGSKLKLMQKEETDQQIKNVTPGSLPGSARKPPRPRNDRDSDIVGSIQAAKIRSPSPRAEAVVAEGDDLLIDYEPSVGKVSASPIGTPTFTKQDNPPGVIEQLNSATNAISRVQGSDPQNGLGHLVSPIFTDSPPVRPSLAPGQQQETGPLMMRGHEAALKRMSTGSSTSTKSSRRLHEASFLQSGSDNDHSEPGTESDRDDGVRHRFVENVKETPTRRFATETGSVVRTGSVEELIQKTSVLKAGNQETETTGNSSRSSQQREVSPGLSGGGQYISMGSSNVGLRGAGSASEAGTVNGYYPASIPGYGMMPGFVPEQKAYQIPYGQHGETPFDYSAAPPINGGFLPGYHQQHYAGPAPTAMQPGYDMFGPGPGTGPPVSRTNTSNYQPAYENESSSYRQPPPTKGSPSLLDKVRHQVRAGSSISLDQLRGHVAELCLDQYGSRYIQQCLDEYSAKQIEVVFAELQRSLGGLIIDPFGNYVVQKVLDRGTPSQKDVVFSHLRGHCVKLSLHVYGCRVMQRAFETLTAEQQISLVREIQGNVIRCIRDQNGNHVIQKCIERISSQEIRFIVDACKTDTVQLASHPYGCRVIQRIMEFASPDHISDITNALLRSVPSLTLDQYGNYVIQHILKHGNPQDKQIVIDLLRGQFVRLAQHKFASNVVEKVLEFGVKEHRQLVFDEVLGQANGGTIWDFLAIMKDKYGNYVTQRMLDVADAHQRSQLVACIRSHMPTLRKYTYGKHVFSRIEQLIQEDDQKQGISSNI